MKECKDCKYWFRKPYGGECRARPPVIVQPHYQYRSGGMDSAYWPITQQDDWCGEWRQFQHCECGGGG